MYSRPKTPLLKPGAVPTWKIEPVDIESDWHLKDALFHLRGAGTEVPDPIKMTWNKWCAVTNRDLLLIGMTYFDLYEITSPIDRTFIGTFTDSELNEYIDTN